MGSIIVADCFDRFPDVLRKALESGKVKFPQDMQWEYKDMVAYRAIDVNDNKQNIVQSDFESRAEKAIREKKFKSLPKKLDSYGCSCFFSERKLLERVKDLKDNIDKGKRKIARGILKFKNGPILTNDYTEHIDWFLFKNVDVVGDFSFI